MTEGLIFAPVGVGIDQLTNMGYRAAGMDAANAGALSGLTSAVAVGGLGAAAGVAAGELAFGPEMLPLAAATLLAGALSSWLGFEAGSAEDRDKETNTKRAQAEHYMSDLLAQALAAKSTSRPSNSRPRP